ncbi:MAG: sigma-70 family RNA polymerase sigma factor [Ardenticatenaceae bacterium]|nr:sigma-70 family RNA polymerase sigma factor [Ardenticatenaceae bacterium]
MAEDREAELIERAKREAGAFGELYELYVDRIYNYIYYRVGNNHDAEDLTARVFFRALASLPRYRHRGAPLSAWLYRIAHNLIANWHRDQSRRRVVALDDLPLPGRRRDAPDRVTESHEEESALWRAIEALHPERQMLLHLKFGEGLSNAQIGEIMGRTEGAVKSLYHRTLQALRRELEQRGFHQHQ